MAVKHSHQAAKSRASECDRFITYGKPFFFSTCPEFLIKSSQCWNSITGLLFLKLLFSLSSTKTNQFLWRLRGIFLKVIEGNSASSCIQTRNCLLKLKSPPTDVLYMFTWTIQTNYDTKSIKLWTQTLCGPNVTTQQENNWSQFYSTLLLSYVEEHLFRLWLQPKCVAFVCDYGTFKRDSAGISICLVCIAVRTSVFLKIPLEVTEVRILKSCI